MMSFPPMEPAEALAAVYGRPVPLSVKLNGDFDGPPECANKPGDIVPIALPPEDVEVDQCSVFVWLDVGRETPQRERLYDHEYEPA